MKNKLASIIYNNLKKTFIYNGICNEAYTYEDIHILALKLITILKSKDINIGDRVSIIAKNSIEAVIIYFSALYYGITIIPINPKLSKNEIAYMLNDSKSKYLILAFDYDEKEYFNDVIEVLDIRIDDVKEESYVNQEPFFNIDKNKNSLIIYSSGTTGRPKAIVHTFFSLANNAELFNKKMAIGADSVFLNFLNLTYLGGYYNLLMLPFIAEGKVVLYKQFDLSMISMIPKLIFQYKINVLWLVPAIASILVKFDRISDEAKLIYKQYIKLCLIGTAPLSKILKINFENKYGLKLHQNYGLSETLFISVDTKNDIDSNDVGEILEGIEVKVLQDGEILVKTPFIMNYYLDNQTTHGAFTDGWFRTGDIGSIKENQIIFKERKKDLIIRGGENISPKEIENVIRELDFIEEVAVVGVEHEIYGEDIVAFVVLSKDSDKNNLLLRIRSVCDNELSTNKIPSNFIFLDSLPRTDSGKINKNKLKEML